MTAEPGAKRYNRMAAWVLVLLTPLVAELALGSTPIRMAWLVLLWMPVYGAGVLLIRELAVRRHRGWPSILLLAVCYELLEDGIGLQALTSPRLYHAAEWGARLLGFNLPYWFANTVYHAVFTVAIPIALTQLLFPAFRRRPYLGRFGLVVTAVVMALGVLVLRVSVPPSEDPGFQAPLPFVIGCLALVTALGVLALTVVPVPRAQTSSVTVPGPATLFLTSGAATLLFFALTFPMFGARQPAFTKGLLVLVPLAVAATGLAWGYRTLTRLANSTGWSDRHTLALMGGALVAHSLGGMIIMADTPVDRLGLVGIIMLTLVGLALLNRRIRQREATPAAPPPSAPRRPATGEL
ncbi:hypothetical protein Cs7R123_45800 [Catellatospora sp. TT07R-123]|uniref:hypothetical protein n=1 Tax=Catellatospora sp. TT07R-123 TaxID=2733863 RepID=UPI001B150F2F|nr:hypothetical protein [Catellatospora sp. TT07R-123]GHJ47238.1 hypothetical protein Cs7R123_45800 [Catellatospora sp. TT07R-123]